MITPTPAETRGRLGHIRPLDGLRAIAVLLVLGVHAGLPGFRNGGVGVDVFFVLSGFLITSLLLDEHRATGTIRLGAFYVRRALRLYPALLMLVAGSITLALVFVHGLHGNAAALSETLRSTPLALFYTMNVGRASGLTVGGFLDHTWSLAIEEQFYLLWPVVVVVLLRRRTGRATLGWLALGCALASATLRTGLGTAGFDAQMLYNATFSHVDGIFAGCAFAALWWRRPDLVRRLAHPVVTAVAVGGGAALVAFGGRAGSLLFTLVAAATVAVLAAVLTRPSGPLSTALSHPVPVAVGQRSYGLYLYHYPIFLFLGVPRHLHIAPAFVLSFLAAWISYAVIERPFLRMKRRWETPGAGAPEDRPRISLLHATYKRAGGPLEVRDAWLGRAADPDSVEYVVAMDADDAATLALTDAVPRLVNPAGAGEVTAVRNWNAAAAAATGDLLLVIADDLFPPYGWDRTLVDLIGRLDPTETPFAVKLADDPRPNDVLLRHPVVSRAFYRRFGLFSPSYQGVYCDNDFTVRAFWRSVILDGRSLRLDHRHPAWNEQLAQSESHDRLNRHDEYLRAEARFRATWSRRKRAVRPRLVATASPQTLSHRGLALKQPALRAVANADYAARCSRHVAGSLVRGGRTIVARLRGSSPTGTAWPARRQP